MYLTLLNRITEAPVVGNSRPLLHFSARPVVRSHLFWDWVCQGLNPSQCLHPGLPAVAISQGPLRQGSLEPTEVDLIKIQLSGTGSGVLQTPQTSAEGL